MKYRKSGINCIVEVQEREAFAYAMSNYSRECALGELFHEIELKLLEELDGETILNRHAVLANEFIEWFYQEWEQVKE